MYYRLNFFTLLSADRCSTRGRPRFGREIRNGRAAQASDFRAKLNIALLFLGAGLRIGQYALGEVLWYDELALVRNFVEKPLLIMPKSPRRGLR